MTALNDMIEMHAVRVAVGVRYSIPDAIWDLLCVVSIIALTTTGFRFGASFKVRSGLLPALVLAFASIVTLISDFDDPQNGFLQNDLQPNQDLVESMQKS